VPGSYEWAGSIMMCAGAIRSQSDVPYGFSIQMFPGSTPTVATNIEKSKNIGIECKSLFVCGTLNT
jgi:hypothetical protein